MAPPSPWWGMGLKAPHATPLGCVPPSPEMAPWEVSNPEPHERHQERATAVPSH